MLSDVFSSHLSGLAHTHPPIPIGFVWSVAEFSVAQQVPDYSCVSGCVAVTGYRQSAGQRHAVHQPRSDADQAGQIWRGSPRLWLGPQGECALLFLCLSVWLLVCLWAGLISSLCLCVCVCLSVCLNCIPCVFVCLCVCLISSLWECVCACLSVCLVCLSVLNCISHLSICVYVWLLIYLCACLLKVKLHSPPVSVFFSVCVYVWFPVCVCLSYVKLRSPPICPLVYLCVCLISSLCLSVLKLNCIHHLSVCLSICMFDFQCACMHVTCLKLHPPPVCLSVCLSVCLHVYLCICLISCSWTNNHYYYYYDCNGEAHQALGQYQQATDTHSTRQ